MVIGKNSISFKAIFGLLPDSSWKKGKILTIFQKIMDAAKEFAPEYDIDAIYEKVAK